MTNDFAVVDQQQTRKSPVWPAVGLAGGATVGYLIGNRKGAAKSYEDLIKEVKDTTDFTSKEDPDMWKSVKDKLAEVDRLEKELANASEAKLDPNNQIAKDLEKVEREAKEYLDNLRAKTGNETGYKVKGFPTEKMLSENLTQEEFNMAKKYSDAYKSAKENLFANGSRFDTLVNDGTTGLKSVKKNVSNFYSTLPKYKPNVEIANQYQKQIADMVNGLMPRDLSVKTFKDYAAIKDYQAIFGEDIFNISDTHVKGARMLDDTTPGKKVWVSVNEDAVKAKREELKQQYIDNISKYLEKDKELSEFDKAFFEKHKVSLQYDLKEPINSIADVNKLEKQSREARDILKQLKEQEYKLNNGLIKNTDFPICISNPKSIIINNPEELAKFKQEYTRVQEIANSYLKGKAELTNARNSVIRQDIRVTHLQNKIKDAINKDQGIKDVMERIEILNREGAPEAEKTLYQKLKSMMNVEQSSSGAAEIGEDKLPDGLKKRLEDMRAKYKEAATKDGKVNEEAKKKAEEALNKGKADLEEAGKKLAEKFGKGGTKGKIIGALIGAAAGCGLLWLVAPKKSKNA